MRILPMRALLALIALGFTGTVAAQIAPDDPALESFLALAADSAAALTRGFDALDPSMREMLVPMLSGWIAASRDAAVAEGVEPIPPGIRAALSGHLPDEVLDAVRWRVDDGALSVQQSLFRLGYTPAVTLDYVIVFASHQDALENPALWAHELFHVTQYRDWGVDGFAARYIEDYAAVEHDAAEFRWRWMKATGRVPVPATP